MRHLGGFVGLKGMPWFQQPKLLPSNGLTLLGCVKQVYHHPHRYTKRSEIQAMFHTMAVGQNPVT